MAVESADKLCLLVVVGEIYNNRQKELFISLALEGFFVSILVFSFLCLIFFEDMKNYCAFNMIFSLMFKRFNNNIC